MIGMTGGGELRRRIPEPAKDVVKAALRRAGEASAAIRPLPDFLVIGTKRGGTTSLWRYLLSHPGVLPMMPRAQHIKSPHYFYWHYSRGEGWYRSHFPTAPYRSLMTLRHGARTVTGEASPYYLYDPRVPARVARLLPSVKIVVLLRDPVDRAYSHYTERVHEGVEPLEFAQALAAEPGRVAGELDAMRDDPAYYSRAHDWYSYRDRGVYLPQLERWFAVLPRERFLILESESFYADPAAALDATLEFLGLPRVALQTGKRHNHRPAPPMDPAIRSELESYYREPNERLAALLGRELTWSRVGR